jgi:hypothetical protein
LLVETVQANLKIVLRFIFVIQGMETLGGARVDCDEKSTPLDFGHSGPRADIDMISDSDCQRGFWIG